MVRLTPVGAGRDWKMTFFIKKDRLFFILKNKNTLKNVFYSGPRLSKKNVFKIAQPGQIPNLANVLVSEVGPHTT